MNLPKAQARYPGIPSVGDGNAAVVAMETAAGEAAGAYAITPATPMGEGFADAAAVAEAAGFRRRSDPLDFWRR